MRRFFVLSVFAVALLGFFSCRNEFDDTILDTGHVKNFVGKWRGEYTSVKCSGECHHDVAVFYVLEVSEESVKISDIEYESDDPDCQICRDEIEVYYKGSLFKDAYGKVFSVFRSNEKAIVLEEKTAEGKSERRVFSFWQENDGLKVLDNGEYIYFSRVQ